MTLYLDNISEVDFAKDQTFKPLDCDGVIRLHQSLQLLEYPTCSENVDWKLSILSINWVTSGFLPASLKMKTKG